MRTFERNGDVLVAEFEEFEVALVGSLVEQLMELLGGDEPEETGDAFDQLVGGLRPPSHLDHGDPLIQRLFPDAYVDDRGAADDFRRYTEEEARRARIADARVVVADLRGSRDGAEPLIVALGHVEAWLKTVNALRLSLSARLHIVDERAHDELARLPARDPRSQLLSLYEWLGYVLESLLEALDA